MVEKTKTFPVSDYFCNEGVIGKKEGALRAAIFPGQAGTQSGPTLDKSQATSP